MLIPLAIIINPILIYPLVFIITSISIFFRPARVAVLPRIVDDDELVTANSAMWVGETIADVVGFSVAGLLVAVLSTALPLAFWFDAATYLASAVLLASLVIRPSRAQTPRRATGSRQARLLRRTARRLGFPPHRADIARQHPPGIRRPTLGRRPWRVDGHLCRQMFADTTVGYEAAFGFLETGVGAGNPVIGGFAIGLIGARFAKGRMVALGYAGMGLFMFLMALSGNLPVAIAFGFGQGVANMVFVIPSQTLFQERTPAPLMGRVVSFRFSLVFGSMTVASGVAALLIVVLPASAVLALFALVTIGAGLAGLFVPAIRDA